MSCADYNTKYFDTIEQKLLNQQTVLLQQQEPKIAFSTTTNLTNATSFSSGVLDMRLYTQVQTHILSDQDGTIQIYFYSDSAGADEVRSLNIPYTGGSGYQLFSAPCFSDYVKYDYLNGAVTQTDFFYETKFLSTAVSPQLLGAEAFIAPSMVSQLSRSVIVAKNSLGNYENVASDLDNKLYISNGIDSLYGEAIDVTYSPMVQNSHMYGIATNPQLHVDFTATGGTVTAGSDGSTAVLATTTSVGSYAVQRSRRVLKYRHGYANIVRVGGKFTTGVALSLQFMGVGNAAGDFYFAMNGADFGIRRSYGGLLHIHSVQITTSATGTENATITLNGTAFTVGLTNAGGDANFTAHQCEIGGTAPVTYTGWVTEHIGDTVYFIADSVGVRSGTYSFSSASATATVTEVKEGTALTTETVAQTDWNGRSSMITTLDPTKYNLYEIVYSWFGVANVKFNVYNSTSSRFENVHTITFANGADLSLTSANLYVQMGAASLGSTTALSVETTGSFGATMGKIEYEKQPKSSASSEKTISTETVMLVAANRKQINGYSNQSELFVEDITVATDGTKSTIIKIILNPTTLSADSTADFTDSTLFDESGLLIYDTTTDTYTGGTVLKTIVIAKNQGTTLNYTNRELFLTKDDTIIITASSASSNDVNVSISFISDI